MMSFSESVRTCMRKFIVTSGRASRSEFWWFQLFVFIMTFLIYGWTASNLIDEEISILIDCFLFLILFIPSFCVNVRRLHDVGCSGFYILFNMIPLGSLYLLILTLFPSEADNKYGPKPFSEKEKKSDKKGNGEGDNKENVKEIIDVEI